MTIDVSRQRGFDYDTGDPSVGIWPAWFHVECPAVQEAEASGLDSERFPVDHVLGGMVYQQELCAPRVNELDVLVYWLLTCADCVQQVIVTERAYDPSPQATADAVTSEVLADAYQSMWDEDDDPSPYSGTYSEE